MVRDDLYITIPSYFRCPISLEVMKSPVSLCTGVTYDRNSIQRWLDGGNNTCPATMQVLHTKELVPNHTLHRLIKNWSESVLTRPRPRPANSSPSPQSHTHDQAKQIVHQLETDLKMLHSISFSRFSVVSQKLSTLSSFANDLDENRKFLAAVGVRVLPLLISLIGKLQSVKDLCLLEKIVLFCSIVLKNRGNIDAEGEANAIALSETEIGTCDFKSSIMMGLKQGRLELRIAIAKFLELVTLHLGLEMQSSLLTEDDEIYSELLNLMVSSNWNPDALDAALKVLTRIVLLKKNRVKMVGAGGVKVLTTLLLEAELNAPLTEKVLKLLEISLTCKEGRNEICGNKICVQAILRKVLKVSNAATEHAVTVLWSLCCLLGDKRASAAVTESNGVAKILLLLQSNCSPAVRQMCGDLLRIFRCNSKNSCLSTYDTKTSHIMPF